MPRVLLCPCRSMCSSFMKVRIAVALVAIFLITLLASVATPIVALADINTDRSVLAELQTDRTFNSTDYPANGSDYGLKVLTIDETDDGSLVLYVYQPAASKSFYRATYARIYTGDRQSLDDNIDVADYRLALLGYYGVFFKYKVRDFTLPEGDTRYYNIVQLARPFIDGVDTQADYDNTISAVPFDVSTVYRVQTVDGKKQVAATTIETVTILDKFVGFVRYVHSSTLVGNKPKNGVDRYFVAFNTDRNIDSLVEIEMTYLSQYVEAEPKLLGLGWNYRDSYPFFTCHKTISNTDSYDYSFRFLWEHYEHHWDLIQKASEFISTAESSAAVYRGLFFDINNVTRLDSIGLAALDGKQWVVSFDDYDFRTETGGDAEHGYLTSELNVDDAGNLYFTYPLYPHNTNIQDFTILRLKFVTAGVVYNLGAIDNQQTGSDKPSSETITDITDKDGKSIVGALDDFWSQLMYFGKIALIVLGVVVALVVLGPVLPYVLKFFGWIITAPIKAIKGISKANKKK